MGTSKSISSQAAAAKAIRQELKAAFPTVKFSVTSESFSMGDAVRVSWIDGPTKQRVEAITGKYQYGRFNGMEDIYENTNDRSDIPQSKYVTTSRIFSESAKMEMSEKMGLDWSEYNNRNIERGEYNNTLIYRELCLIDFTNIPETVAEISDAVESPKENVAPAVEKEKTFVTVTFPDVNKNNTLLENFEAMAMYGTNEAKCLIQKTVELDEQTFELVSNSLLENRPEMWEQIGGAWSDAPEFEALTDMQVFSNKELTEIFRATCYTPVVEVVCNESGRKFYVNTEGYDYARYVGMITYKNRPQDN